MNFITTSSLRSSVLPFLKTAFRKGTRLLGSEDIKQQILVTVMKSSRNKKNMSQIVLQGNLVVFHSLQVEGKT